MPIITVAALLLAMAGQAQAWTPECRQLSQQLASEPGTLKIGDLDVLRTCITGLQRAIVNNEPLPEATPPAACPPPPPPQVIERPCPACPACPKAEDPARQRFIPRY